MKKKVLVDVTISCIPDSSITYWRHTLEQRAKAYEEWAKELQDFIRDHRSRDDTSLEVNRVYEDECSFCGASWETDDEGRPLCCSSAQEEWEEEKLKRG